MARNTEHRARAIPERYPIRRYGASYADFIDIVFHDEVYREAVVRRVFDRYLARLPGPAELAHDLLGEDDRVLRDPDRCRGSSRSW